MTTHKKYLHFDPAFVLQAVSKRMQERGLAEPPDLRARVEAALSARGYTWITREQMKDAAKKAQAYTHLYAGTKYEPFLSVLAAFRRAYAEGSIPEKEYGSQLSVLQELQERDSHSYQVLADFWNDLELSRYGSPAVADYLLDAYAEAFIKHPIRANKSKVFWTMAPAAYDYGTTRQIGAEELLDPLTQKEYRARQVEIMGDSEKEVERRAEDQQRRYQSGFFDLTEINPLDTLREGIKKSEERKRMWEGVSQKKKDLTEYLLDMARTAPEVRAKRDEAFDLDLTRHQTYPEYAPAVYDQALAAAELRDKQREERDKKATQEAAEKRRYPLLVPKDAPLRFLYQHDEKIAALVADDVLSGAVSLKEAQNAVGFKVRDYSAVDHYVMLPVQAVDSKITYQDFFELVSKSNLYRAGKNAASRYKPSEAYLNDAVLDPREIPRAYAPTRKEAYAALPEAVREAIKKHQKLWRQVDVEEWVWEKVKKYEDSYGYLLSYNADYVVFSAEGRKLGSNTTAFKKFVAQAQAARGY